MCRCAASLAPAVNIVAMWAGQSWAHGDMADVAWYECHVVVEHVVDHWGARLAGWIAGSGCWLLGGRVNFDADGFKLGMLVAAGMLRGRMALSMYLGAVPLPAPGRSVGACAPSIN